MTFGVRILALLAVSACCAGVSRLAAQNQTPVPTDAPSSQNQSPRNSPSQNQPEPAAAGQNTAGQDQPVAGQLPPSPVEEREQLIRQVDPLDREDEKKARAKADRDAQKKKDEENIPVPGSVAESEQSAARRPGPVVEDEDNATPVQEYTGPAVLSRSYSITDSLVPEQVKFNETLGVSDVYDTGITRTVNSNGSPGPVESLKGVSGSWSFSGRHYFRRDVVSLSYTGNYSQYSGNGGYSGSNQSMTGSYLHQLTKRIQLNLMGSGSILSQNTVLENQPVGPGTIANINLASSPNIQIFDNGAKQMSTQADLTWQESARLSFSMGGSYFGIERDSPLLLGVTGRQARGDVNYRLTRQTTIGAYYSFSSYLYPHGFGNSDTNTFGAIYSYAFDRTTQLRFRGGLSEVQSLGLVTVAIPPPIAALLGTNQGEIDSYATYRTSDFSVQFVKDFRHNRSASIAYARGISPGNGVFQTSQQESISANLSARVLHSYTLSASAGRDSLKSVTLSVVENLGNYQSDYARLTLARTYRRGVGASFAVEYRHFGIDVADYVRNQLRITSGITWGSGTGRLWPF